MITLLTTALFVATLVVLWRRWAGDFPGLAVRYLCISPFLPLVSLFNHNFDSDRFGTFVRTLPVYAALALLALAAMQWRRAGRSLPIRWGGVLVLLYALFSLVQVPFSIDPAWALCAWSFSVPGYLIFLLAGRTATTGTVEARRGWLVATVVGFVGINVSLIAYGLWTGRVADLFLTRNLGSVWASNTLLAFLVLFGGLAWVACRRSAALTYVMVAASLVGMLLSLSRTALLVLAVYFVFLTGLMRAKQIRVLAALVAVALSLGVAFVGLREPLLLDSQLVESWKARFRGGALLDAFEAARETRREEFAEYADTVRQRGPFVGAGFGTFNHFSIYTDAHNLLLTEAFENSLLSAVLLVLAFGLVRAVRALTHPTSRPLGAAILGFLVLGQLTGAMLSYRSYDNYYATYPGWILFFMVGLLNSTRPGAESRDEPPAADRPALGGVHATAR